MHWRNHPRGGGTRAVRPLPLLSLAGYAALCVGALWHAARAEPAADAMLGFNASAASAQASLEQRFDAQLDAAQMREWLQQLSSAPNNVGSAHDAANAQFMLREFREWGWDASIETFNVLYPTPRHVALQMIAPTKFTARLGEPPVHGDASSALAAQGLPPYNVYGADGDVTGELVYVNRGTPEDYLELARRGISVQGRIVIARYGGVWRGLKPKLAREHGAIGCVIYSDPRDDGYSQGDAYPQGGWRPADGVQRGSVADIVVYPGDPQTPGTASTPGAPRVALAEAATLTRIPVLPISYADAQPLLASLAGPVAPEGWRGALPITYHIGAGPARVHLQVQSDWSQKPIYDVIARLPGATLPDEWVVRGNHHDGWVFGAWDPLSGNVAMMAEAKAIGALVKSGWRPSRTLVYASWDGEEPGLLGSTEWAEAHAQELKRHVVLYVNSDENSRGFLNAAGSHSLQRLVNEVGAGIHDPETDGSVLQRLGARLRTEAFEHGNAQTRAAAQAAASGQDLPIGALGSGSDFSPFLQHLGIATVDLEYSGEEDQEGVYHSAYDTFEHYLRFGDPGLRYGVTEAETVGHLVLRVADAVVLPWQFTDLAQVYAGYVHELHELADAARARARTLDELLDAHAFELSADPQQKLAPPQREGEVPFLDFAPLDNAAERLERSARAYDAAYAGAAAAGLTLADAQRAQLDALLQGIEQALTDERGLPGRPWYQHLIYAPGMLTGYGAKTMPGVREGIEGRRWDEANDSVRATAAALQNYCARLDAATLLWRPKAGN
jgi:N-acetylated-alpha-linked acidic dipeptidase